MQVFPYSMGSDAELCGAFVLYPVFGIINSVELVCH